MQARNGGGAMRRRVYTRKEGTRVHCALHSILRGATVRPWQRTCTVQKFGDAFTAEQMSFDLSQSTAAIKTGLVSGPLIGISVRDRLGPERPIYNVRPETSLVCSLVVLDEPESQKKEKKILFAALNFGPNMLFLPGS